MPEKTLKLEEAQKKGIVVFGDKDAIGIRMEAREDWVVVCLIVRRCKAEGGQSGQDIHEEHGHCKHATSFKDGRRLFINSP